MNDKTVKIIYGVATAITIGASLAQALLQGKVTNMEKVEFKKEIIDEVLKKVNE